MIRSTLWRSLPPVRCRACGGTLIDKNSACPACGAQQKLKSTTLDASFTLPAEQRTRWSLVPVRNRMIVPYPSIREAAEEQAETKTALRQSATRRIATASSSVLALIIGAIALTHQSAPRQGAPESKAHSASGPIAAVARKVPPVPPPPTVPMAAVAAGPAAGPLMMIAPPRLAAVVPPEKPETKPAMPARVAAAAPDTAELTRAVRHALKRNELATARRRIDEISAAQQKDAEVRRLASQISKRERERDTALRHARSCEKNKDWPCAVHDANSALAMDHESAESQALLQRASAATRAHAPVTALASRNAGPAMTSLTAELTTERRGAAMQPPPAPAEDPDQHMSPTISSARGRGEAH